MSFGIHSHWYSSLGVQTIVSGIVPTWMVSCEAGESVDNTENTESPASVSSSSYLLLLRFGHFTVIWFETHTKRLNHGDVEVPACLDRARFIR